MDSPMRPLEELSLDELSEIAIANGMALEDEADKDQLVEGIKAITMASPSGEETDAYHAQRLLWPSSMANLAEGAAGADEGRATPKHPDDPASSATLIESSSMDATVQAVQDSKPSLASEQASSRSLAWPQTSTVPTIDDVYTVGDEQRGDSAGACGAASVGSASDSVGMANESTDTALEQPSEQEGRSGRRSELVDTFVGVTQASRSKARQFLNATDWSIDAALNLFMESGGDSMGAVGTAGGGDAVGDSRDQGSFGARNNRDGYRGGTSAENSLDAGGVGRDVAGAARSRGSRGSRSRRARRGRDGDKSDDDAYDEGGDLGAHPSYEDMLGIPGLARSVAYAAQSNRSPASSGATGGDAGAQDSRYPNGYSEDGVRAPIPTRRDTLIGAADHVGGMGGGVVGSLYSAMASRSPAEEEKDTTDWIFDPPEGLSLPSSFIDTRTICKEQRKWLMVNIQDHEEFASHRLNKDVWSNETIQTLLRGNFVFWQRNKTLRQARYYIEKYNLAGEVLPHTAIIDPRTGTQLVKVVGYVEPEDLSTVLLEFLENNNLDQTKAPKLKVVGMGNVSQEPYKVTPMREGKEATGDERSSPGTNSSGGALPDTSYTGFEMGSEDYEYEDDDDDLGQGSSVDGNDGDSTSRASTGTSTSAPYPSGLNATPAPSSPFTPTHDPRKPPGGPPDRATAAASRVAVGTAELVGPWGLGTTEDEARARAAQEAGSSRPREGRQDGSGGEEGQEVKEEQEEVLKEPEPGEGVTQVRFRLPNGVVPATIARRFWLKDRVSVLFQFVRNMVEGTSGRSFDLLSGHPPSSISASRHLTVEAANLSNSAILMRWT